MLTSEKEMELIQEFIPEFQIPPYVTEKEIKNYAVEGQAYLEGQVPSANFVADPTARMLLKNYMYYAYNHAVAEYLQNYEVAIRTWQMNVPIVIDQPE